jgi:hypothetical protein
LTKEGSGSDRRQERVSGDELKNFLFIPPCLLLERINGRGIETRKVSNTYTEYEKCV